MNEIDTGRCQRCGQYFDNAHNLQSARDTISALRTDARRLQAENADLHQQLHDTQVALDERRKMYETAVKELCTENAELRQQLAKYQRELAAAQAQLVQAQAAIAELINRMGTYAFVG